MTPEHVMTVARLLASDAGARLPPEWVPPPGPDWGRVENFLSSAHDSLVEILLAGSELEVAELARTASLPLSEALYARTALTEIVEEFTLHEQEEKES